MASVLDGKSVVVTGASRGIGAAVTRALAAEVKRSSRVADQSDRVLAV